MAILELTITQRYEDVECVNRFNYISSGTPAALSLSFLLVRAVGAIPVADVYPAGKLVSRIAQCQVAGVTWSGVTARDIYSNTDFYSLPALESLQGFVTGEGLAPFVSLGFSSSRVRADIRRGYKRFVGVSESVVGAGGTLIASFLNGQAADLAAEMSKTLVEIDEGNTVSFTPVVLGRQRYNPATGNPDPAGTAWRYYPTFSEQSNHVAAGVVWSAYNRVRSQTSRQLGRGR